jgi:hydrogenase expression/formation protein HypD
MKEILTKINSLSQEIKKDTTLMEVCGGHTNTIMRYGIRKILPKNIKLISGPGCPVCVTSQYDIDSMIELARNDIAVATYGDMLRVPGSITSLDKERSQGKKIFMIYSTTELLELKKKNPNIVFFGIGFETTTPMTAFLLENNISVYSVHKVIPEPMIALLDGKVKIDGFIDPGHVASIIGLKEFRKIPIAQAISGFEPEHILKAIYALLLQIKNNKKEVINTYPEIVKEEGNIKAQNLIQKHFFKTESLWRGLGSIPNSGMEVKNDKLNAKIIYKNILKNVPQEKKTGCRCGEILQGKINPKDCPLFKKACSPKNPKGACMVSEEGSCQIAYNYD